MSAFSSELDQKTIASKKYAAVIFDVGDTLLEAYPSQVEIYSSRMQALGFTVDKQSKDKISDSINEAAHNQIMKEQQGAQRMPDDEFSDMLDIAVLRCFVDERESVYLEKLKRIPVVKQELKIIPGTLETLTTLKSRGIRLAVVSNHRIWLPDFLSKIGLADFFEVIIVSDIVGFEKPDVHIMEIALEKLLQKPEECLYVGDHPFDVLCAKKAGMDCAWLAGSDKILPDSVPYKEDIRLSKLLDLTRYV